MKNQNFDINQIILTAIVILIIIIVLLSAYFIFAQIKKKHKEKEKKQWSPENLKEEDSLVNLTNEKKTPLPSNNTIENISSNETKKEEETINPFGINMTKSEEENRVDFNNDNKFIK